MTTRVFVDEQTPDDQGTRVQLSAQESHYALRVRRLQAGASLIAMDGRSRQWAATIVEPSLRNCLISLDKSISPPTDLPTISLLVGRPDIPACLEVITGACELGVQTIGFVDTARSQRQGPSPERVARTIQAAMRQCGRFTPPDVMRFATLEESLQFESHLPLLFGDLGTLDATTEATEYASPPCRVAVGPEGGWSRDERALLTTHGATPVRLSPWVLRTPTAALAIVVKSLVF